MKQYVISAYIKTVAFAIVFILSGCMPVYDSSKYEGFDFLSKNCPVGAKSKDGKKYYYVFDTGKMVRVYWNPEKRAVIDVPNIGTEGEDFRIDIHKWVDCEETSRAGAYLLVNAKGQIIDYKLLFYYPSICDGCKKSYQKALDNARCISPAYKNGKPVSSIAFLSLHLY